MPALRRLISHWSSAFVVSGAIREAAVLAHRQQPAKLTDDDVLNRLYEQIAETGDSFIDANPIERETLMTRLDELFDQVAAIKRTRRT